MKKLILTLAAVMVSVATFAQGSILFGNRVTSAGIDAKITFGANAEAFGFTSGAGIEGSDFTASLWTADAGGTPIAKVGDTVFRTGAAAGYLTSVGVTTGTAGVATTFVVVVNDAQNRLTSATSLPFTVTLSDAGKTPADLPANPVGIQAFSVDFVPEPSTFALAALGGLALVMRRRK